MHLQTFSVHPPASWAAVGIRANAMHCSFLQVQDALLLHPVSEHPSKEQQSLTRGFCLVLCRERNAARGLNQPLACPIGLELREVWHSLIGKMDGYKRTGFICASPFAIAVVKLG